MYMSRPNIEQQVYPTFPSTFPALDREQTATKKIDDYGHYVRPKLGEILEKLKLNKKYHRAEGNYVFYFPNHNFGSLGKQSKQEIAILDFLGGYGSLFFGHHHPRLLAKSMENLSSKLPFACQLSVQEKAGALGKKLAMMMEKRTGKTYLTTFGNTGTEATEAAIKHAELKALKKIEKWQRDFEYGLQKIRENLKGKKWELSPLASKILQKMGMPALSTGPGTEPGLDSVEDFIFFLKSYNYHQFQRPPVLLALKKSFHGKTFGALGITEGRTHRIPLKRMSFPAIFVDYEADDDEDFSRIFKEQSYAVYSVCLDQENRIALKQDFFCSINSLFVEPLQGEGGVHPIPVEFLRKARNLCDQYDVPLVFDEIQCGMGRTGTFLFSEQMGVFADYYLLSKSLGGGLGKISALLIQKSHYQEEFGLIHSSTFAEDNHSADLALEALNLLENDPFLMKNCREKGEYLLDNLRCMKGKYPQIIKDVRGKGLMIGIEFQHPADSAHPFYLALYEQGLVGYIFMGYLLNEHGIRVAPSLSHPCTLRIGPSAFVTFEECDRFLRSVNRLALILQKQNTFELIRYLVDFQGPSTSDRDESEIEDYSSLWRVLESSVSERNRKRIAFVGHIIEAKDLIQIDPSLRNFPDDKLEELIEKTHSLFGPALIRKFPIRSQTGEEIDFYFYGMLVDAKTISNYLSKRDLKCLSGNIQKVQGLAQEEGCEILGLGGYTSIVTNNGQGILAQNLGITTGNAFTVAMGLEGILEGARISGIDLRTATFAAVGALGNIAQSYCLMMAESVPEMILIGKRGREKALDQLRLKIYQESIERLWNKWQMHRDDLDEKVAGIEKVLWESRHIRRYLNDSFSAASSNSSRPKWHDDAGRLRDLIQLEWGQGGPVQCSQNIEDLVKANLIVSASNSPGPLIFPSMLREDPVVICDIALPLDTHPSVRKEKKNLVYLQGGVVKLPCNQDFQIPGVNLPPGYAYACMSETMLLGLSGIKDHFSYGAIDSTKVRLIRELAKIHGFKLGMLKDKSFFHMSN